MSPRQKQPDSSKDRKEMKENALALDWRQENEGGLASSGLFTVRGFQTNPGKGHLERAGRH